ncbi:hypothetical protein PQR62_00140 [Herbaspirillum lusitanum]|jgi:hypothetical protein|uniref:SnoaL-like domain-containing protein n=1 Tax=Herbaspirillum lusitanum TaxID=213312 RepID=A0ABW9A417_9BURK
MLTHKSLLEAYVYAKDKCCPSLIDDIYEPNAVLSISVAGDAVSFPPLVVGAQGIAQTLVTDFATRFTECRTYYVCGHPPDQGASISGLPWLVLMRDIQSSALRIGRGHYDWSLNRSEEKNWRATEMHIRIDRMDVIEDATGNLLPTLQEVLPYPWLSPHLLDSAFSGLADRNRVFSFLREFCPGRFGTTANERAEVGAEPIRA